MNNLKGKGMKEAQLMTWDPRNNIVMSSLGFLSLKKVETRNPETPTDADEKAPTNVSSYPKGQ